MFSAPVVWTNSGRTYLFVADDGGTGVYVLTGGAHPRLTLAHAERDPRHKSRAGGRAAVRVRRTGRIAEGL